MQELGTVLEKFLASGSAKVSARSLLPSCPPKWRQDSEKRFASLRGHWSLDISYVFVVNEVNNSTPVVKMDHEPI